MEVSIQKLHEDAILPIQGSMHAAGYDLFSYSDVSVPAFGAVQVRTGIAIGWTDPLVYLQLQSRSGLFIKHGITCEGGVIDWDYLKEIVVLLQNHTPDQYDVKKGDRICQGVFLCVPMIQRFSVVEDWLAPGQTYLPLPILNQRYGGLGSTGK
jgi:dUTP pyrophosphatase